MAPPASKSLRCSHCAKTFGRSEHLKRHELIHTDGKNFICNECGKGFQRRDALNRHEVTHRDSGSNLLSKGARACNACALAKTRCSGDLLCARCQQRGIQCIYPDSLTGITPLNRDDLGLDNTTQTRDILNINDRLQSSLISPTEMAFPSAHSENALDPDFWDPNILSTSNWLDAIIDDEFQGLQFDQSIDHDAVPGIMPHVGVDTSTSSWQTRHDPEPPRRTASMLSPAVGSNASPNSGRSTETAAEICAAGEASTSTIGEYYVDGEPARLPRTKRRKLSSYTPRLETLSLPHDSSFSLQLTLDPAADLGQRIHIPHAIYEQFISMWRTACHGVQTLWTAFATSEFPPKEICEHLIGLYFAKFHQTLPFLHPPTFNVSDASPLFLLAMISIGAQFLQSDNSRFAVSLSEVVRRNLVIADEDGSTKQTSSLALAQTRLLLSVSFLYSGDTLSIRRGMEIGHTLALSSTELIDHTINCPDSQRDAAKPNWKDFVQQEHLSRVFYAIWLLDSMWAYQFQKTPILALKDGSLPLPCHEGQWRAASAEEWETLASNLAQRPSLKEALQELYIDKRLPKDRGEFARIIMIHGLFQRTWEVERYYSDPLTHWSPTAKKQTSMDILPAEPIMLPAISTYAKWQNSVCDCIDILHWQANATIGKASGLEHPTVAFLHLSRVVLLSPINVIVRHAKSICDPNAREALNREQDKIIIHKWATQSQYKARLAAIHAGVVFWHIRRYSVDGFYEAPAVALAALMLWAFGQFAPRQTSQDQSKSGDDPTSSRAGGSRGNNNNDSQNEASDDSTCAIILLDRPTDDELVQQFIRRGNTMRANMTGVGDLYGPQGPQRVLLEGCKLLQSLKSWGVVDVWFSILQKVHQRYVDRT